VVEILASVEGHAATSSVDEGDRLPADTLVGAYRIRAVLGEGAMGEVYLAQDLTLGRRVALKLIKRAVMDTAGLGRFLDEARVTASFSHPHIVTLHAFGEHDGRPYLALEYVDGESLRARMTAGPLPVREALQITRAIADAIGEAHARGLVHADLKPENVLIPRDGRVRVVDFGLARLVGAGPAPASGTPAYMAPERWRGEPPDGAIDVWSVGMILYELIHGERPISDRALMQLAYAKARLALPALDRGASWAPLVEACLATDPAARPSAPELVRRLETLIDARAGRGADDAAEVECPFPGLAAFTRDDAAQYFGRGRELDEVVERLRGCPLVPIVGPSGIGKSSFIHAALIPRLEDGEWNVVELRPGAAPFENLAAALAVGPVDEIAAGLREAPERLTVWLGELAARAGGRVAVFLDQFEEVFTLAPDAAAAFCDCLAAAAIAAEPWRLVLAIRDDFLSRLAERPRLQPHLGAVLVLAPLGTADLRQAIARPLASAGYDTDTPDLPARIVADVHGQPACLPLLQFTCRQLWDRRDVASRRLSSTDYEAMGGATGALAAHAQRMIAQLSPAQVKTARTVLLALLNPDGTRRPRPRAELVEQAAESAPVIERLLERRLIVSSRESDRDDAQLELAHEALATAWPQLARWVDETSEQRLLLQEIEQGTTLWQRRGRADDATWSGAALAETVRRVGEWDVALSVRSRAFLDAGLRRERARRRRRRWVWYGTFSFLVAIAIAAVLVAVAFRRRAREAELASADLGRFTLELVPYDWDAATQRATRPRDRAALAWTLYEVSTEHPSVAGRAYPPRDLRRGQPAWQPRRDAVTGLAFDAQTETVEARSGEAFIRIERGACGDSVIHLWRLPGYTERELGTVISLAVPTCQASREDTVPIPAGPFIRNLTIADGLVSVDVFGSTDAYRIDAHEVTRAAFARFAAMASTMDLDEPSPRWPNGGADDRLPMTGITYRTAESYCAYHGKSLPTIDHWQKAFRGPADLAQLRDGTAWRPTPWGGDDGDRIANTRATPGPGAPAAVGSYAGDRSPFEVYDLGGNVSEYASSRPPEGSGLRLVLGGSWDIGARDSGDAARPTYHITWTNARPEMDVSYGIGFRCTDTDTGGGRDRRRMLSTRTASDGATASTAASAE
jgi:eukaryotic-like serine/threonine-protein kinase